MQISEQFMKNTGMGLQLEFDEFVPTILRKLYKMPNAKEAVNWGKPAFLLMGNAGAGKTTQLLTLPGKKYAYLFDPRAINSLKGYDIEYDAFLADDLQLGAVSLSKGRSDPKNPKKKPGDLYNRWEKDFEKKQSEGFFDQFDAIMFDSFTTFSDMVMDRILEINGRAGQFPQQDDWGGQMQTISNVIRTFVAMDKVLLCTAHEELKQDEGTKRMQNTILLTGRLRIKLPLLFSELLHMECASTPTDIKYQIQTRPDRLNPAIRTSFKGLDMFHDVTVKNWANPENYGLGKIMKEYSWEKK